MTKSILHPAPLSKVKAAATAATLLFALMPALRAQSHALTLRECVAMALGESSKLEANRLDLLAAGENVRAARASLWPTLTGTADSEIFEGESTGKFGIVSSATDLGGNSVQTNNSLGATGIEVLGLKLTYPLFRDGSIFGLNDAPAVESFKARREALEWTKNLTREEVIYRIAQAFVATVSAENRGEPIDRRVELLERSLGIAKEQQGKGLLLPVDVSVANEQLNGARALAKVIHEQSVAGSLGLTRLLGMHSSAHIRLVTTLPTPPEPPSASLLLGNALTQHPSLGVQRANISKAKQDYRLERFRLYPSVTLHGGAAYVTDFSNDAHEYTAGIAVGVPIFDFGAQLATVRARRDTYAAEQARLNAVGDDVANEVLNAYEQIYALSESILTLQSDIGKLDRDLRVTQSQQQQGIAQPLASIDAELQVVGKRDELAVAEARRLLLYAGLQRATGGTWKWLP
jgi:multidrug efflux system outer membrane protein